MTVDSHQGDRWAGLEVKPKTIFFTIFTPVVQYGIGSAFAPCDVAQRGSTTGNHGLKGFLDNAVGFF